MKRRVRVLPPGYLVGTKGHSVLKKKTYVRKPLIEVEEFSYQKMPTSRRHEFDSGYQMGSFHDARTFSNAVMDDSYDLQSQSRGRDHRLLTQMNSALHTDRAPTSPLLSSRSSKSRNSSQLQHKPRRSTRLDTSGTDPLKTSKLSDSLKTSRLSDSFKTSKPPGYLKLSKLSDSPKTSRMSDTFKTPKQFGSLKLSKLSDSLKTSKPLDSFQLSKPSGSLQLSKLSDSPRKPKSSGSLQLSEPSYSLRKPKPSGSLQLSKPSESLRKPKPSESLQLTRLPDPIQTSKLFGIDRVSPVVEHARSLLSRHRTFGINSELDTIATSAITSPRNLKSDFFSVSPLTNYIKTRWPEKEPEDQLHLTSPLPMEVATTPQKTLYKNPYLELDDLSDDEDYETSVVLRPKKTNKPGQLLQALRKKRSSDYATDESTDIEDEDSAQGACAITKYVFDEDLEKPRRSKKYELSESPDEIALSHLVSTAAIRARAVLENLTGLLGKGGLVSVEGDIKPYGGALTSFRLHTPFHFQGPLMIGEKPALSVGDDSFERYIFELQEKRKQERENVEKGARRMTKLSRSLGKEPPKHYSLRPIGYISDKNYESFSNSLVPYTTKFDKTIISPSSKMVHFEEANEQRKPTLSLSRELVPFAPKNLEDEEMAVVPRRRRFPIYEYTEDIPVKLAIKFPLPDDDTGEDIERLSVLEKIRIKALLVGEDKLDVSGRPRSRKPRSRYYADKLQKMEDKEQLSSIMATPSTSTLRASKPPKPIPTYTWRAIRDVDGYTTPSNLMSWQYKLDSRLEPEDLIHKPSTYGKMRDQVRGVQDKLDRHRQLMDRHARRPGADTGYGDSLAAGGGFSVGRTTEEAEDGMGKVSPLRKKLRKVICKSRHDPTYYDD